MGAPAVTAERSNDEPAIRDLLRTPAGAAAALLGSTLMALLIWWPFGFGAFFPTVLYPGLILLLAAIGVLLPTAPIPIRRRGPHLIAFGAMIVLAAWTLASALWSATPDAALEDGLRTLTYGAFFFVGLWLAALLDRRAILSAAPFLIAVGVVAVVTLVQALAADTTRDLLSGDGTLDYPLGYRNANAAFFFIAFFIGVGLTSRPGTSAIVRGACGAVAAACLSLGVMSQSRGAIVAGALALIVFLVTSGDRRRSLLALAATTIPVAVAVPTLIDPFEVVGLSPADVGPLHRAAVAAVAATAVAGLLSAGLSAIDTRLRDRPPARIKPRPLTAVMLAGLLVLGAAAVVATTDPGRWIDDRIDEFEQNSLPDLAASSSRFSVTASSTRSDYWEVALAGFTDNPLLGDGAGGFEAHYLRDRTTGDTPRDAHSAPLEVTGELGLPGIGLLVAAFVAALAATVRSRRFGTDPTLLSTIALTVVAYWAVHASIDWFWAYPIPTVIAFGLLGVASSASSRDPDARAARNLRRTALIATIVISLATIPLYLAERLTVIGVQNGVDGAVADAYDRLNSAADLDPLAATPLLAKAELARRNGQDEIALAALDEAESREPDNYLTYLIRARVLSGSDPAAAIGELARVDELNPRDPDAAKLRGQLEAGGDRGPEGQNG